MERVSKVLLMILTVVAVILALGVEARVMKTKEQVEHPQNFYGGAGGAFFPGSGPGFATGIGFSPSGFCTLPGGCVPTTGGFPTIPGGSIGTGGGGSVPMIPHD
ncbi:hypothetical protein RchiOBHm_Chr3g0458221 [Rosa chinensis]|uniref:Glycine-rich protein n=1 Tax=Rosa chinensis TaxID=74649 RepID=A0A2P6R7W2_ROSCH|nr:hypothetical protein RchiOBHm_Chr3g0458221 [Rosa chinensis]